MNKSVNYLKGLIEGFAISSKDSAFEWQHFKDVTYHAQMLGFDRELDENLTLLIAIGHDLGRIHGDINGKGHAKQSAIIFKKMLSDYNFLELYHKDDVKTVLRAIKNHSRKHRIDDAYSELIKDADTLAHVDEKLLIDKEKYEFYRYRALISSISIDRVASIHNWIRAFEKLSGDLAHVWHVGFIEGHEIDWVHHVRTTIRKLRSILVVFRKLCHFFSDITFVQRLNDYEENLVKVLKKLEVARRLAVLMSLSGYDLNQNKLNVIYKEELVKILHQIEHEKGLLSFPMISFEFTEIDNWQLECQSAVNKIIKKYVLSASKLKLDNVKKIHKVRIFGKQLKYLFELGLIENADEHLSEMIFEYHDLAGDIHDLEDAIEYKHANQYFDISKLREKQAKAQEKLEKNLLFFIILNMKSVEKDSDHLR